MKEEKITIRLRTQQRQLVEEVAKYLKMDISECIRNSLRYGLNSLLKFETSGQLTLNKMTESKNPATVDRKNDKPKEKEGQQKKQEKAHDEPKKDKPKQKKNQTKETNDKEMDLLWRIAKAAEEGDNETLDRLKKEYNELINLITR